MPDLADLTSAVDSKVPLVLWGFHYRAVGDGIKDLVDLARDVDSKGATGTAHYLAVGDGIKDLVDLIRAVNRHYYGMRRHSGIYRHDWLAVVNQELRHLATTTKMGMMIMDSRKIL